MVEGSVLAASPSADAEAPFVSMAYIHRNGEAALSASWDEVLLQGACTSLEPKNLDEKQNVEGVRE